jgi:hypothetical protein
LFQGLAPAMVLSGLWCNQKDVQTCYRTRVRSRREQAIGGETYENQY